MKVSVFLLALLWPAVFAAEKPIYNIPSPAQAYDNQCVTNAKFRTLQNGIWSDWQSSQESEISQAVEWINADESESISLEEGKDGSYLVYTRTRSRMLPDGANHLQIDQEDSSVVDGQWNTVKIKIERIRRTENGKSIVTYNAVNGVETPYYWDDFTTNLAEKEITTSVHTNPAIKNTADKQYSEFYVVCEITKRRK